MVNKQYWHYSQNNSGGSFDQDDDVCTDVIIEASSVQEANSRAESVGIYFNGCDSGRDCSCCGDRWYPQSGKGDDVPSIYGTPIDDMEVGMFRDKAIVHYIDGTKRAHTFKEKIK